MKITYIEEVQNYSPEVTIVHLELLNGSNDNYKFIRQKEDMCQCI